MSAPLRPRSLLVPVSARRPLLDGAVPANEALRIVLFEALAQISANIPVVIEAQDSEGLHQLRIGLRRLRTALTLTHSQKLAALDLRAKEMIAVIGPARDCDVFHRHLFLPAVKALGPRQGFDLLGERVGHLRSACWQTAMKQISSPAFQRFENAVAKAARTVTWAQNETIAHAAPALLDHALRRAGKRGRRFEELDPPSRHRLRIALKKLRYTSEFFAPLYPRKTVKHWLEPLKELQDMLGDLNDVAQLRSVIGRLMLADAASTSVQADLSHAAGLLQGFHQTRGNAIAKTTAKRWKEFRDTDPFWT